MPCTTWTLPKDDGTLVVHSEQACRHGFLLETRRWVRRALSQSDVAYVGADLHEAIVNAELRCEDDHAE